MSSIIRYVVGNRKLTEEEYVKEFGAVPSRLATWAQGNIPDRPVFEPYYDRALRKWCTSYKDQETKVKQYNDTQRNLPPDQRDKQHPDGFVFANDDHKFMKECKYISKHGKNYRELQRQRRKNEEPDRKVPRGTVFSIPGLR